MPLHIEYRPKTLDEFIGNKPTVNSLSSVLNREDKPHTYLFSGPSGCGKTTLARIVANEIGCSEHDFMEINSSNNRGIDTAREIISNMKFSPISGKVKIYLLDEVHQTTKDFQNALLKALEDTPSHVYFLLCTTQPDKLLNTIINRCSQFTVQKLPTNRIIRLLMLVSRKEGIILRQSVYEEIARAAEGSPRQALVILDQIRGLKEDEIEIVIRESQIEEKQVIDLCRALMSKEKWKTISEILKGIETEPEKVRYAVLGYFTSVLLNKGDSYSALVIDCFKEPFYNVGKAGLVAACYEVIYG